MHKDDALMHLGSLETHQVQVKVQKELLADILANDPTLEDARMELESAKRNYQAIRKALLNEPEAAAIIEDLKELGVEIKEIKSDLSYSMLGHYAEEKSLEIEDDNGDTYRLHFNGKMVQR